MGYKKSKQKNSSAGAAPTPDTRVVVEFPGAEPMISMGCGAFTGERFV
jgi:hypothetical protein